MDRSYTGVPTDALESPHFNDQFTAVPPSAAVYVQHKGNGLSRRFRILSLLFFLCLEIGYLALAVVCYRKPLLLPHTLNSVESKGILTVIFIVWQALAAIPVQRTVMHIFSSEWFVQLSRTGMLVPGVTDRVSTLTASVLNMYTYALNSHASASFRVALITSMALLALHGIAPGVFTTSSVLVGQPISVPVGNFTLTEDPPSEDASKLFPINRAALISRLEQVEKSQFGYAVEPNWVVGWPPLNFPGVNSRIEYPSDGVHYQHKCTWEPPEFQASGMQWVAKQITWGLWDTAILTVGSTPNPNAAILPLISSTSNGSSAYLFLGSNTTLDQGVSVGSEIDLSGIPSTYNSSGYFFGTVNRTKPHYYVPAPTNGSGLFFYAPPLASVLVCDPQMSISSVTVARDTNMTLQILSSNTSSPRIGNIQQGAANIVFSEGLLDSTSTPEPYLDTSVVINFAAASMFLADPTLDSLPTRPLGLDTINANVDANVASASKAYAGGYYLPSSTVDPRGNFSTILVGGVILAQRLVLTVSVPLLVATFGLVAIPAVLLGALAFSGGMRQTFSLENIFREMQSRQLPVNYK